MPQLNNYATIIPHLETELSRRVEEWAKPENKRRDLYERHLRRYFAMEAALHLMRGNSITRPDITTAHVIQEVLEWAGEMQKTIAIKISAESNARISLINQLKAFATDLKSPVQQNQ
jgi:hypothetical protein